MSKKLYSLYPNKGCVVILDGLHNVWLTQTGIESLVLIHDRSMNNIVTTGKPI